MSVSAQQIMLVRNSFALVHPSAPQAAELFYKNLFDINPALRLLFTGDMGQQGQKLMQMIGAAVGLLDRPDQLLPVLRQLGARHGGYGVQDSHYAEVGQALIQTLEQGLGEAFCPATRQAWLAVYDLISRTMIAAARKRMDAMAA